MSEKKFVLVAILGSLSLLLGAFAFQYIGGYPPCKLCYWQRYPHIIAIFFGVIYFYTLIAKIAYISSGASFLSAAFGAYHFGIEQGFWQGPNTCSSGDVSTLSTDALIEQIMSAPIIKCDEVIWSLFNISMAGWNTIFSAFLGILWITILMKSKNKVVE